MPFNDKARRFASLSFRVARLQRLIAERPDDKKLQIALLGLSKRSEIARTAFYEATDDLSVEVLDYRISQPDDSYPLKSITESLGSFQSAITATFDAVSNGPKSVARYTAHVKAMSSLNFELFYPGSKGFVLSVPSKQDLFGGSFDETAEAFRSYIDISSTDAARDASRSLGLAAVSTLYKWVAINATWGNSIDYDWKARPDKRYGQHIAVEKFSLLRELFDKAEETEQSRVKVRGTLVGLDVAQRRFHVVVPNGESYRGMLHSDFPSNERTVPKSYIAHLLRSTTRTPATGEESENHELLGLEEIDAL